MTVKQYYVYIMASYRGILYTGVTNDLARRVAEHRLQLVDGFSKKYHVTKLVYFEATSDIMSAITREKQVKGWRRGKKVALIEFFNPYWIDLAQAWEVGPHLPQTLRFAQGDSRETCTPV